MVQGKKRTEVRWDIEKDADIIKYLNENVDNIAGFLKTLARDYVRNKIQYSQETRPSSNSEIEVNNGRIINTVIQPTNNDNKNKGNKQKKRLPIGLNSISSEDLGLIVE